MANKEIASEHETGFVRSFIITARSERYLSKLSSSKHRRAFLDRLNHRLVGDLDVRFLSPVTRRWPNNVEECYIIADEAALDGRVVSATEAEKVVASAYFGIVVSFIPGKLACYKSESPSELIWLEHA